jgi:hypothetical protein
MPIFLVGADTDKRLDDSLNANEQREFAARMERKQLKEFMTVCLSPNAHSHRTPILLDRPVWRACIFKLNPIFLNSLFLPASSSLPT